MPLRFRKPRIPLSTGNLIDVPDLGAETPQVALLRAGDHTAFVNLVNQHTPSMLRVARRHVHSHETAEEVVQETWLAVYRGMATFEGRSSLRTWLFTIMVNIAKARGVRERRDLDVALAAYRGGVDWVRLADHQRPAQRQPESLSPESPEGATLAGELSEVTRRAIAALPDLQRSVLTLRAVLDVDSGEVCRHLNISAVHQRVLLHHGRTAVRRRLHDYVTSDR